jgi:hypothetical protein
MTTPSGLGGQFGYITETTVGTLVTVNKFLPVNSAPIGTEIEPNDSMGIRAGRLVTAAWKQGKRTVSGTVEMDLWNADVASMFKHMFGAVSVATNGAQHDYTYTPDDHSGLSFSSQVGVPDINGVVRPRTFAGCKVTGWSIGAEAGSLCTLSLDIAAMTSTNGVSLAAASYDSALEPFVFTEAFLLLAGSTTDVVSSFELTCESGMTDRFRIGTPWSREYKQNGFREFSGSITKDFESEAQYNRYMNGDEAALVFLFDNGTDELRITANVRFNAGDPTLEGPEIIEEPVEFKVVSATNDAAGITAVLTNGDGFTGAA